MSSYEQKCCIMKGLMILFMVQTSQNNHLETYKKKPFVKNLRFPSTNRPTQQVFLPGCLPSTLVDGGLYTRDKDSRIQLLERSNVFFFLCPSLFLDFIVSGDQLVSKQVHKQTNMKNLKLMVKNTCRWYIRSPYCHLERIMTLNE